MKNYISILFVFSSGLLFSQWNIVEIGTSTTDELDDIVMVDGRNDGMNRIYAGCWGGTVEEWYWDGAAWNSGDIISGIFNGLIQISGGDGRNDGINRIYVGEHGDLGRLYEVTWDGSSWNALLIATPGPITSVMVGDARNDGTSRLYAGGGWGIEEYEWDGAAWTTTTVSLEYSESNGLIGDANNDGANQLYINGNCEKEFLWTGSSWFESYLLGSCPSGVWTDANHIGMGRNDGDNRIYCNGEALGKVEYTWSGGSWVETIISTDIMGRGDIHVAALHADTLQRVYGTNSAHWTGSPGPGPMEEFEWDGSTWVNNGVILDGMSGASGWMAAGTGRNDDTMRLYIPNMITHGIYEITSTDPNFVGEVEEPDDSGIEDQIANINFDVYPNPANDLVFVIIEGDVGLKTDLIITNVIGEEIQIIRNFSIGQKTIINLESYNTGIYFIKVKSDHKSYIKRLVVIK